jgi:hypothetical protein
MANPLRAHDAVVRLDYGQFSLCGTPGRFGDYMGYLEDALRGERIAGDAYGVVVCSPQQNNFEMRLRVEVWVRQPPEDQPAWEEIFQCGLVVDNGGLRYQSPTMDQTVFDVPVGDNLAELQGLAFGRREVDRRYASYRRSPWRRPYVKPRLFRSVRLNSVGWLAVAALCLAGAGAGYGVGRVVGLPRGASPVVGTLLGLITLVAVDRRRWGRLETGFSWGNDPDAVMRVGTELQRQGVPVQLEVDHDSRVRLRYHNRDAGQVRRALNRFGVRLLPHR